MTDERPRVLYSISAWGARPIHSLAKGYGSDCINDTIIKINAGVGIRWDRQTGGVTVAVAVCNDKDRFIKKVARNIVRGRLEKNVPTFCYHGDHPIADLFVPVTKGFRDFFLTSEGKKTYRGRLDITSTAAVMAVLKGLEPKGVKSIAADGSHTCGREE